MKSRIVIPVATALCLATFIFAVNAADDKKDAAKDKPASAPAAASSVPPLPELFGTNGPKPLTIHEKNLKVVPTIESIGVYWDCDGDANANATGTLDYREKGAAEWKHTLPLLRSPKRDRKGGYPVAFKLGVMAYGDQRYAKNYLAGSILFLKPATAYEVKVKVTDPDGGGAEQTVEVTTRAIPTIPKTGHVIEITGGGAALRDAVAKAQPGDIFNVHAGAYDGNIAVDCQATADKPVCIKTAGDGKVEIVDECPKITDWSNGAKIWKSNGDSANHNTTLKAALDLRDSSHIIVDGLCFEGKNDEHSHGMWNCTASGTGAHDNAIMHCKMHNFYTAMSMNGSNNYYADNFIDYSWNAAGPHPVGGGDEHGWGDMRKYGYGIAVYNGANNVIAHNAISGCGDLLDVTTDNTDIIGNDVIFGADDGTEIDSGGPNIRLIENRYSFTGQNGISFQPYIGGPAYLVRNLVVVADGKEHPLKVRYESDGIFFVNNTLVSEREIQLPLRAFARNNIFYRLKKSEAGPAVMYDKRCDVYNKTCPYKWVDIDYNGCIGVGPNGSKSPEECSAATGQGAHDRIKLSASDIFATPMPDLLSFNAGKMQISKSYYDSQDERKKDPKAGRPHPDLQLKAGSPAIGAGGIVPNLAETPDGKAPDLGALPHGQPLPHWGPREDR